MRGAPVIFVLGVVSAGSPAHAQERTLIGAPAIEAVAAITTGSDAVDDPFVFLDLATTFPIGSRFGAIVRPYAHRLAGGEWEGEMYQLQLRFQSQTRLPIRIDAGIITSPLGLGALELRPDLSAAIKMPFYYYMPLPGFEAKADRVQLLSGGYPLGAIVSASGAKWDARAGVTDSTPARSRNVFAGDRPSAMRQFVAGGGLTPITGLRFGAGFASGAYRSQGSAIEPDPTTIPGANATVFNLEGEYAIGHTRFSGEWVRNHFESSLGPAIARGYFVQAVRTFGPRLFGTVRHVSASSPASVNGARERRSMTTTELTAGYRLGRELTARGGYYATRRFGSTDRSHTAIVSLVWAQRWF